MSFACRRLEELHGVLDAAIEEEVHARGRLDESKVQKAAADKVTPPRPNMHVVVMFTVIDMLRSKIGESAQPVSENALLGCNIPCSA